jgi:hypothetical protein
VEPWEATINLRAKKPDALRQWADMEGKSPTMRDDLYRRHAARRLPRRSSLVLLATSGKLIAAFVHAWLNSS